MNGHLFLHWEFNIYGVSILLAAIIYFYKYKAAPLSKKIFFAVGLLLLIIALCSPLHWLANHYLMSAHMIVHVLVLMIATPFLLAGLPYSFYKNNYIQKLADFLYHNLWLAWLVGIGTMWFWHIPFIHEAILHPEGSALCNITSNIQLNSFFAQILAGFYIPSLFIAGFIFCLPIFLIYYKKSYNALMGVIYLFTACVACSLLGIIFTFSTQLLSYHYYIQPDFWHLRAYFDTIHLTAIKDQQLAGLIMWVPGCMIYLSACMILLTKWYQTDKYAIINTP